MHTIFCDTTSRHFFFPFSIINKGISPKKKVETNGFTHIITGMKESQPLSPHIDGVAKNQVHVVGPEWVSQCLMKNHLVDTEPYLIPLNKPEKNSSPVAANMQDGSIQENRTEAPSTHSPPRSTRLKESATVLTTEEPVLSVLQPKIFKTYLEEWGITIDNFPSYCCQRPTPLHHYNEDISSVFDEMASYYEAINSQEEKRRATSFYRMSAVIKVCFSFFVFLKALFNFLTCFLLVFVSGLASEDQKRKGNEKCEGYWRQGTEVY